ncbi:hypothetical protein WJX84_009743 [Apatococcus fuscideae]|uniref:N-acetyltransferase domain-containing protein n=1 Tax=Apatococcus fuscideae TaxID=2026836 RepID=A0AAW1SUI6_9CHLO
MAKKTGKGKDKKLQRQEESKKLQLVKQHLLALNQAADVLRDYQAFQFYERNGLAAALHFATGAGMPEETVSWAYELCKANMEEMYRTVWGWKPEEKRQELRDLAARYLIATSELPQRPPISGDARSQERIGYVHWRFEEEDGEPIMYIMEVQLAPASQGKGLGKFLGARAATGSKLQKGYMMIFATAGFQQPSQVDITQHAAEEAHASCGSW